MIEHNGTVPLASKTTPTPPGGGSGIPSFVAPLPGPDGRTTIYDHAKVNTMTAALKYPPPDELDTDGLAGRDLALAVARAVSERHPGPQYDHKINGTTIEITSNHPAHKFSFGLDLSNPDIRRDPLKAGKRLAMEHLLGHWASRLLHVMRAVQVTNANGDAMTTADGITALQDLMRKVKGSPNKFMFVGNGGSAAIASHMAEDFTKNGGVRAVTFNDAALMSCYANDYGWDFALEFAVTHYGASGDVLVGMSSSGKSANIHGAVNASKDAAIVPVTFSGFDPDNPLRKLGQLNFYVPSHQYGFVETAHAAILHAALDIFTGWVGQS